ncbi:DEAD/DEAH box helicase [Pseudomonas lopnurensis]|uniref:DEAD/DEAH box helicase n=1 Tax=Pseudomonas lopnurensis TaxID=1477517 RepID=UPI0028B028EC|nr:DEAD/DEAH box helicase [Pseudomonas lopnurensis]
MSQNTSGIDNLPAHFWPILCALVTLHPGQGKNALLNILRKLGVRSPNGKALDNGGLGALLDELQRLGLVRLQTKNNQPLFCLAPELRNQTLMRLLVQPEHVLLLAALRDNLPTPDAWQRPSRTRLLQELWLDLLLGDAQHLGLSLMQMNSLLSIKDIATSHPVQQLQADASGQAVLQHLDRGVRSLLLEDHLALANLLTTPATLSYRMGLQEVDGQNVDSELCLQLLLQAFWRGDWPNLQRLGRHNLGLLQETIDLLLKGQVNEVLRLLRAWLADVRKQTKQRKIDLPPVINGLYILALIAENDPKQRTPLKQAINLGIKEHYGRAYGALSQLLELLQSGKPQGRLSRPDSLNGFEGLLHALALYWLDDPEARSRVWCTILQTSRNQLEQYGYAWLAAEFDALIARQFGIPRQLPDLHGEHGLQPLVGLYQRQESWQLILNALAGLKSGQASTTGKTAKGSRLAWLIHMSRYRGLHIEPREQKLGAKGQWSKGRPVALSRLLEDADKLDFLCEQDRQACKLIRTEQVYYSKEYRLPAGLALPKLVGHPALFWDDAPDVRIDLQTGEARLHLQSSGGQIHLKLEPEGIGSGELFLEKQTPTRVLVYPITREIRQIAEILGDGLSVPQSAKAQLIEAIGAIAPLLPIHSDIPELASHVEEIPANPLIHAHLLPLGEGLRLQLLVRPLTDGGWFRPGHGSGRLLGEHEGRTVQAVRNFKAERERLNQVLDVCPGLANADSDGQEWQLYRPQDALQVLSELQTIDGELLQCVWPEGERMRIKGHSDIRQLKLGLTQQGDWFQLQGGITLDDGKVLQLRQLLELLQASPGRFIKLSDNDWLAIGNSLRKRLDELTHLAERISDQGLRLSPLSTPLLAELAEEAGEFKAGKQWQQHLQRLQSLRDYQPAVPSTLQAELRDYQIEGFTWLARLAQWGVGACLADDMGLGKTVQTLALLLLRAQQGPQLVVAPTSVALNWINEARRFAPTLQLHNYHQQRRLDGLGPRDLVITSYGLLQQDSEAFAAVRWTSVVLDEAQAIKNAQTKRSQAAMVLQAEFRMVATGTPLENHLGELWNLFRFINPGLLGSQDSFAARFANPIENGDAGARRALKQLIQPFILRRLKNQVLDELPARTEITYSVPLSDDEVYQYEALRQQAVERISAAGDQESKPLQVLAEITRLRRFCCHPSLVLPGSSLSSSKLLAFQQIVTELLENHHKALVFSQFVDHLGIVRTWLDQQGIAYQYLDGSTPAKMRQAAVEAFQAGQGEVFLISLKAGGSGLNLTAADYVIHLDPWWNPAVEDQASDRAHRMGQQRPVTIYRLVTEGTIEQQIVALHGRKRDLADSLLDGGEVSGKLDAQALLALLKGA